MCGVHRSLLASQLFVQNLGLYARRPKLLSASDDHVKVKFNQQIVYGAMESKKYGIPMIGGCPLAKSFQELSLCKSFLWVNLSRFSIQDINSVANVLPNGKVLNLDPEYILCADDVLDIVDNHCKEFELTSLIDVVKNVKMAGTGFGGYHPMLFMGGYKPVYLLLANP